MGKREKRERKRAVKAHFDQGGWVAKAGKKRDKRKRERKARRGNAVSQLACPANMARLMTMVWEGGYSAAKEGMDGDIVVYIDASRMGSPKSMSEGFNPPSCPYLGTFKPSRGLIGRYELELPVSGSGEAEPW